MRSNSELSRKAKVCVSGRSVEALAPSPATWVEQRTMPARLQRSQVDLRYAITLSRFLSHFIFSLVVVLTACPVLADDWPQWLGPKRDSVWRETGIVEKFPVNGPTIVWRSK